MKEEEEGDQDVKMEGEREEKEALMKEVKRITYLYFSLVKEVFILFYFVLFCFILFYFVLFCFILFCFLSLFFVFFFVF